VRIAYGIHGYGQGHATRAWAVLPELLETHDVKIFAGGDALDALGGHFKVEPIPTLRFGYVGGRRSTILTVLKNAPLVSDLVRLGASTRKVLREFRSFAPDVVICDCEPWTFRAAGLLSIPRIAFDHFGIMVRCKASLPFGDWVRSLIDRATYEFLMGGAERALVSSFYTQPTRSPDVKLIPPLLRERVRATTPRNGAHLLAYFNQGATQLTKSVLKALTDIGLEVRLYGAGARERIGNVVFQPPGDVTFLDDLASCRAVISTAGNQLMGEAMALGKPVLVVPENSVEQRMNAAAVERMAIGERVEAERLTAATIARFLERSAVYAESCRRLARGGQQEAVETLQRWIAELSAKKQPRKMLREAIA
jgi:uncharacterized protein (TIGR00661 family)